MDKSLRNLYRSFPYILYRGKFLIPQPPRRPRYATNIFRVNPFSLIKTHYPHIINEKTIELFDIGNNLELQEMFKKEHQKATDQYVLKFRDYMKEYVSPFKTIAKGIKAEMFYYHQHKSEILDIMDKEGQQHSFKVLYRVWKQLAPSEKQKYQAMARQAIREGMKIYQQSAQKYMVPQKTFQHPHILYLRDTVGIVKANRLGEYKLLPDQKKEKYRKQSSELKRTDRYNLEQFLEKRQLNVQQFQFIKEISLKVDAIKAKRLQERKKKSHAVSIQGDDEEDEQFVVDVDTHQNSGE